MELRTIFTFLRAAELRNFSKAADSLGYAQSTVTMQIQQLEEDLRLKENELAELRQELAETEVRLERLEGYQE